MSETILVTGGAGFIGSHLVDALLDRGDKVLVVGSEVEIVGHNGVHYLKYLKRSQYAYSGNPQLRHKRFLDAYGLFAIDKNPGEIEVAFDNHFRNTPGPDIWRPVDPLGGWGIFGHIGKDKSYK